MTGRVYTEIILVSIESVLSCQKKKFNDKMLYKEPGTAKPSEWVCPSGRVQMERTGVTRHGGDLEAVWDLSGADC